MAVNAALITGLVTELTAAGVGRGRAVALVVVPGCGLALAWDGGSRAVPTGDPVAVVRELAALDPRWTWWSARETAGPLVAAGVRPRTCWDLGAVGRLVHGLRRGDPAAVWAAAHDLPEPPPLRRGDPDLLDLLDLSGEGGWGGGGGDDHDDPVRGDGQLDAEWARGSWAADPGRLRRWAELALAVQRRQEALLRELPDPRPGPPGSGRPPLALLTALSESAAALLAVELEHEGLPLDRTVAAALLTRIVGERPADPVAEAAQRRARDAEVLRHFPEPPVDLRSPQQVRELLARIGFDLPDTRSWRLEPHAATSDAVAALLAWRKAERVSTTYGWGWLDEHVGADGRLRGSWAVFDGGAGRMTASAGLHNMPAELRDAVRAEPGHVLVRADLGQVEPRVLATVSGDEGLARAAREDDMYAPVAAQLACERPRAKVAVLAAMYGQTSGTAGAALRDMDRAYPRAMAYLRAAEQAGRAARDLRTYGGRLLRLSRYAPDAGDGEPVLLPAGYGRFARNAVVQGAAAELFKAWAATVRAGLDADGAAPGDGGRIVLCLHDELVLHVPQAQADRAAALLVSALESTARWWAAGSAVRFVADVTTGASWADAH
ncbi:MAG: DNA polymerase [Frankiaceae bacterium]